MEQGNLQERLGKSADPQGLTAALALLGHHMYYCTQCAPKTPCPAGQILRDIVCDRLLK